MQKYVVGVIWLLVWAMQSCYNPYLPFTGEEVRRRVTDSFPDITDTLGVGVLTLSQNAHAHWFVAYNKLQTFPRIYLYHTENRDEPPHKIVIKRPQASIENIELVDVTYDGVYEMLIWLKYDYDLSFQGEEIIILQNPFDTVVQNVREIFSYPLHQAWERIDTFDTENGMPVHFKKVENDAVIEYYEDIIELHGTIEFKKHHFLKFRWRTEDGQFEKIADEDLHEAEEEEKTHKHILAKATDNKMLLEVVAHDGGCRSFVVENTQGHVVDIPPFLHDALLCSPITSLSNNGRYLVFTNRRTRQLQVYDFLTKHTHTLLSHVHTTEGISEMAWSLGKTPRIACIVINPEEYIYNTRIYVFDLHEKREPTVRYHDVRVYYECNAREGACVVAKDYDFRFNNVGNFVYRIAKEGSGSTEFAILDLSSRPMPKPKTTKHK